MLDGTHYFECGCGADEHTLRFTLDLEENDLHTSIFLHDYRRWYQRLWVAIKYTFGYKCKYGHWDCWILHEPDAKRLRNMLDEFLESKKSHREAEMKKWELWPLKENKIENQTS